jgi:hypothetical protein
MLEDLKPPRKISSCAVRTLRGKLDKKDQEILDGAIADPEFNSGALARELSSRGLRISDVSILRHRKKECSC